VLSTFKLPYFYYSFFIINERSSISFRSFSFSFSSLDNFTPKSSGVWLWWWCLCPTIPFIQKIIINGQISSSKYESHSTKFTPNLSFKFLHSFSVILNLNLRLWYENRPGYYFHSFNNKLMTPINPINRNHAIKKYLDDIFFGCLLFWQHPILSPT
jgi:hypothetical protein